MLYRILAVVGYPAHLLNSLLSGPLGRIGLSRVPGALLVGLALAALAIASGNATREAYAARPVAQPATISDVVEGRVGSLFWIAVDGLLIDGPHITTVEVFAGPQSTEVERVYYLFADPAAPEQAVIVRAQERVPALEAADGPVRLDGTVTEDPFNMQNLLAEWDPAALHPEVSVIDSRLISYGFETPFVEPSWIGTILLGGLAAVVLVGALVRQPILRRSAAGAGEQGLTPIAAGHPRRRGHATWPRAPARHAGAAGVDEC